MNIKRTNQMNTAIIETEANFRKACDIILENYNSSIEEEMVSNFGLYAEYFLAKGIVIRVSESEIRLSYIRGIHCIYPLTVVGISNLVERLNYLLSNEEA